MLAEILDLRPYDDLESLTYTLLYLLMGDFPWRIMDRRELTKTAVVRTLAAKKAFTIPTAIPVEFHDLLDFTRNAKGNITGNLTEIRVKMHSSASTSIGETKNNQLEVIHEDAIFTPEKVELRTSSYSDSGGGPDEEEYSNSYWGWTSIAGTRTL